MATNKKTTEPKIFTQKDIDQLNHIVDQITTVRHWLDEIAGDNEVSQIMFTVGKAYVTVDNCEDALNEFIDKFSENEESEWK